MRNMNKFADLEAFVTVVDAGSFSAAAERLQLAKSAVSRRISELESRLGIQLLNRTTRRLSLTEAGESFHLQASRILADLEEAELSTSQKRGKLQGRLRLAAPLSFGLQHLMPALNEFLQAHPEIELDLDLNDRQVNLVEEGFDMAVRIGRLEDSTLIARKIGTIRSVTCASPDYLQRAGRPADPAALRQYQGLEYTNLPKPLRWRYIGPDGSEVTPKVPCRLRANNGEALMAAALQGLGIVRLPSFLVNEVVLAKQLEPILTSWQGNDEGMYAVYPPGRYLSHRVRLFTDFLAGRFGDTPYWDDCLKIAMHNPSHE